jgi:hypothetical protein
MCRSCHAAEIVFTPSPPKFWDRRAATAEYMANCITEIDDNFPWHYYQKSDISIVSAAFLDFQSCSHTCKPVHEITLMRNHTKAQSPWTAIAITQSSQLAYLIKLTCLTTRASLVCDFINTAPRRESHENL